MYYRSGNFIFFVCFDEGVGFGCCRLYFYRIFVLILVLLCYICELFVECVFGGILVQIYYLIFLYESINFLFQCISLYCDHGSTFVCPCYRLVILF